MAQKTIFSLSELNGIVSEVLDEAFGGNYWIVAEVSEIRPASSGHCFLELIEKEERTGKLVAKARATIWKNVWPLIRVHFQQATGHPLEAGMKVLLCAAVTFHKLYGYSLSVSDIDPSYTLGDAEKRRQEIIEQLSREGTLNLNQDLPLPRPISRIAIVSSDTAAGYGDFVDQLRKSGYRFATRLFPAIMQGDRTEESVCNALCAIADEMDCWDVVVIIRGGGAVSDLSGFDTYLLAASVAQFPLPVFTGIGHERDNTVIDYVAHTRFKTPTAVAAFLIEQRENEVQIVADLAHRLTLAAQNQLSQYRHALDTLTHRFSLSTSRFTANGMLRLSERASWMHQAAAAFLHQRTSQLEKREALLPVRTAYDIAQRKHRLDLLAQRIATASPERLLAMGYSITTVDGHIVRSADQLQPGAVLTTTFAHGRAESVVQQTYSDNSSGATNLF